MPVERGTHLVEVVAVELTRVVELVVVHQVAEAADRAMHLRGDRLVPPVGLVAAGDEARDHRAERPDAERGLHRSPPRQRMTVNVPRVSNGSQAAGKTKASPARTCSPASSPSPWRTSSTPKRPAGSTRSSMLKNSLSGMPSAGS